MTTKRKVLVIDDSAMARELAAASLRAAGYDVEATENPITVPRLTANFKPDLIVVDVTMPALSGDDVVEILRKAEKRPIPGAAPEAAPILLLHSSLPEVELSAICLRCRADGYLVKSNNPATLVAEVDRRLKARK